jgi:hypothetical protein
MMLALARVPIARLTRTRRTWLIIASWVIVAIVAAVLVRARGNTSGADHVMRGSFGRFVLPLLEYAIVGSAVGGIGMRRGIRGLVGLGSSPRQAALATAVVAAAACAIVGGLLAAIVCAVAHGPADPPLGRDLFASTWIGALGGAAYGAYFAAGSAIGKGGTVRGVFLAADFIVGSGAGIGAALVPRGHVVALLGGPVVADLPQRASSVLLVVLIALWIGVAVLASRRAA